MPPSELVIHEDHALDPGAVVLREKAPAEVESRRRCVREIVAKKVSKNNLNTICSVLGFKCGW